MTRAQTWLYCLSLALFYTCVGLPTAHAQSAPADRMRVLLNVDPTYEPEYLCVVGDAIQDSMALTAAAPVEDSKHTLDLRRQVFSINELNIPQPLAAGPESLPSPTSTVFLTQGRKLKYAELNTALGNPEKGDALKVQCVRNALVRYQSMPLRLLVLRLLPGSEGNIATITGMSLVGNLVTLQMTGASVRNVFKALAIVGLPGDYEPSEPRFLSAEHQISLPVEPTQRTYELKLPPSHVPISKYNLQLNGQPFPKQLEAPATEITLQANERKSLVYMCPLTKLSSENGRADLSSKPAVPATCGPASAEGNVFVLEPSDERTIDAKLAAFTFSWVRHCGYPFTVCPDVKVLGTSAVCTKEATNGRGANVLAGFAQDGTGRCEYRCVPSAPLAALPLDLEFSYPTTVEPSFDQTWSARLEAIGQELTAFTPPTERRLIVKLDDLCPDRPICEPAEADNTLACRPSCVERTNQMLEFTEIRLPGDRVVRIKPDAVEKVLSAPGLNCDDTTIYQHHGEQSWAEASVPVEWGYAHLPDSMEDFHNLVGFSLQAGAGLSFPSVDSAQFESDPHATPVAKLEGLLSWRVLRKAYRFPLDFELRFGSTFGEQWYETFRVDDDSFTEPGIEATRRRLAFSRVLLHSGATYHFWRGFYAGHTIGISNNRPLFVAQEAVVPASFRFFTSLRLGFLLTRFLRVELEELILPGEPTRSFEFTFLGAPRPRDTSLTTYLTMFSFRFDDPL